MTRCSDDQMLVKLEKLFKKKIETGSYRNSLNEGLIFSIHKSGEKYNPNNYWGITLSNSLGKLFNTILYNKLTDKLMKTNFLSPVQAGFGKDHRPSDHIFTHKGQISVYLLFLTFTKRKIQFRGTEWKIN